MTGRVLDVKALGSDQQKLTAYVESLDDRVVTADLAPARRARRVVSLSGRARGP